MAQPHRRLLMLIVLALVSQTWSQNSFECYYSWRSDGNYYDFDICMSECRGENNSQNVTNLQQQILACCTPECQSEISYHTTKRTIIIVIASVLLFMVVLCCVFGCCGPTVKQKWVLAQEAKKRKVSSVGYRPQEFDREAMNFKKKFAEDFRDHWQMGFHLSEDRVMQWFELEMIKKKNYKYQIIMRGQDGFGLWVIEGYLVNTEKGPTFWGIKNYENIENNTISFENESSLVLEVVLIPGTGNYEGMWYNRNDETKKGQCWLKKKIVSTSSDPLASEGEIESSHDNHI